MQWQNHEGTRDAILSWSSVFLPPANEVWGKVIFSEACVKNSVHEGEGVPGPGGRVPGPGGSAPRGGLVPGESGPGGCLLPGVVWRPPPGQLLLPAVRILLECILVIFMQFPTKNLPNNSLAPLYLRSATPPLCGISIPVPLPSN